MTTIVTEEMLNAGRVAFFESSDPEEWDFGYDAQIKAAFSAMLEVLIGDDRP